MENNSHQIWRDWLWWLSSMLVCVWHTHCFLERTRDTPSTARKICMPFSLRYGPYGYALHQNALNLDKFFGSPWMKWYGVVLIRWWYVTFLVSVALTRARHQISPINPDPTICVRFKIISELIEDLAGPFWYFSYATEKLPVKNNS